MGKKDQRFRKCTALIVLFFQVALLVPSESAAENIIAQQRKDPQEEKNVKLAELKLREILIRVPTTQEYLKMTPEERILLIHEKKAEIIHIEKQYQKGAWARSGIWIGTYFSIFLLSEFIAAIKNPITSKKFLEIPELKRVWPLFLLVAAFSVSTGAAQRWVWLKEKEIDRLDERLRILRRELESLEVIERHRAAVLGLPVNTRLFVEPKPKVKFCW